MALYLFWTYAFDTGDPAGLVKIPAPSPCLKF